MPKCNFCGKDYEISRGLTIVGSDGTPRHFCSSKCKKNFKLGRDKRKVNWVRKKKNISK